MKFDQIITTNMVLKEKQIQPAQQQKYGNILFIGGGSGSGKNWVVYNLTDIKNRYKIFDLDDIVEVLHLIKNPSVIENFTQYIKNTFSKDEPMMQELLQLLKSDGILGFIKSTDEIVDDAIYNFISDEDMLSNRVASMVFSQDKQRLNNIAFNGTLNALFRPYEFLGLLKHIGYDIKNTDFLWVITSVKQATKNVQKRNAGVRGMDIEKALSNRGKSIQTMFDIVEGKTFLTPHIRDCYVVINIPEHIKYYPETDVIQDFKYFKFKVKDMKAIEQIREFLNDN